MTPYRPRSIEFRRVEEIEDWRIKLYDLSRGEEINEAVWRAALPVLARDLTKERSPFVAAGIDWNRLETYNVGFAMINRGADANFLLLDVWIGENMLRHTVWCSPLDQEPRWQPLSVAGISVCVWELAVQAHERAAWIKHVYNEVGKPDFDAYLSDTITETL